MNITINVSPLAGSSNTYKVAWLINSDKPVMGLIDGKSRSNSVKTDEPFVYVLTRHLFLLPLAL